MKQSKSIAVFLLALLVWLLGVSLVGAVAVTLHQNGDVIPLLIACLVGICALERGANLVLLLRPKMKEVAA